jgi:hypothetical protein
MTQIKIEKFGLVWWDVPSSSKVDTLVAREKCVCDYPLEKCSISGVPVGKNGANKTVTLRFFRSTRNLHIQPGEGTCPNCGRVIDAVRTRRVAKLERLIAAIMGWRLHWMNGKISNLTFWDSQSVRIFQVENRDAIRNILDEAIQDWANSVAPYDEDGVLAEYLDPKVWEQKVKLPEFTANAPDSKALLLNIAINSVLRKLDEISQQFVNGVSAGNITDRKVRNLQTRLDSLRGGKDDWGVMQDAGVDQSLKALESLLAAF